MLDFIRRQREQNPDIRRLYAINILRCSSFYLPVIVPYYANVMQVDFAGFLIGEAFFAGGMVLLEVPTGYLSDIWKRRLTMVVASLFWLLGTAGMLVASGLVGVIICQLLMAVGASLMSGSAQAMLYEYLAEDGRQSEFRRCEGRRFAYGFYALALTSLPAGLLFGISPYLPVILGSVAQLACLLLSLRLREPARARRDAGHSVLRDVLATMKYALYGHKEIAAIILLTSFMLSGTKLIMWIQQPYYQATAIPVEWFGLLSCAVFAIVGVSGQLAHRLERWIRPVSLLGVLLLAEVAIAATAGGFVCLVFAPLLMAGQALYGVINPVIADIISQRSEPERRATILSAQGLACQLMFMLLCVPYGQLSDANGPGTALLALAGLLVVGGGPAWLLLRLAARGDRASELKLPHVPAATEPQPQQ